MDHGIVHRDTGKIAVHYLQGSFAWDVIASLPIDFFTYVKREKERGRSEGGEREVERPERKRRNNNFFC